LRTALPSRPAPEFLKPIVTRCCSATWRLPAAIIAGKCGIALSRLPSLSSAASLFIHHFWMQWPAEP
jgi:hypothetical protein